MDLINYFSLVRPPPTHSQNYANELCTYLGALFNAGVDGWEYTIEMNIIWEASDIRLTVSTSERNTDTKGPRAAVRSAEGALKVTTRPAASKPRCRPCAMRPIR